MQGGDRNTSFFHLTTLVRTRKNKIEGLFDDHGEWIIDSHALKNIAVTFFSQLFTMHRTEDVDFNIPRLFPEIDPMHITQLFSPVSMLEVN